MCACVLACVCACVCVCVRVCDWHMKTSVLSYSLTNSSRIVLVSRTALLSCDLVTQNVHFHLLLETSYILLILEGYTSVASILP